MSDGTYINVQTVTPQRQSSALQCSLLDANPF